jgi:hypothetical protein
MRTTDADYLYMAFVQLLHAMEYLDIADNYCDSAWNKMDDTSVIPDSTAAQAQDYQDAILAARKEIGNRLNTWNRGNYEE